MAQTLPANLALNDTIDEPWVDAVRACLAELQPTAWVLPTFANGWSNFGGIYQVARYRKVGDVVQVEGLVKGGTFNVAMFTLPVGFRPPLTVQFAQISNGAAAAGISVQTDGGFVCFLGNAANVQINVQFSVTP